MGAGLVALLGASACDNTLEVGRFYADGAGGAVPGGGGSGGEAPEFVGLNLATGPSVWSKRFGDTDEQFGRRLAVDSENNVITAGTFRGAINFGGTTLLRFGEHNLYIAKFDAAGDHLWSTSVLGTENRAVPGLVVDASDNIIMGGDFKGILFLGDDKLVSQRRIPYLTKIDKNGHYVFSKAFSFSSSNAGEAIASVARSGVSDIVLFGVITGAGSIDFGGGPLSPIGDVDVFVAKFDGSGDHVWSKRFGGNQSSAVVSGLVVDDAKNNAENIYLAGVFKGSIDLGGGPLVTAKGGGKSNLYVAKLDGAGHHLWSKRFGEDVAWFGCGSGDVTWLGCGILLNKSGHVFLSGDFAGAIDFGNGALSGPVNPANYAMFVAALDSAGTAVWSKSASGSGLPLPGRGAVDASGNLIVSGSFVGSGLDFGCGGPLQNFGKRDIFLAKLSTAGKCLFSKRFGDAFDQIAGEVAVDGAGGLFMTGSFAGSIDFGAGLLTSKGNTDVFLTRFGP